MIEKIRKVKALRELVLDRRLFYRVKKGQTAREIEKTLCIPANACFAGQVMVIEECLVYTVQPFETYRTIASKYGKDADTLQKFNNSRPLYPTCKIYIP